MNNTIVTFKNKITQEHDLLLCNSCDLIYASPFQAPGLDFYTQAADESSKERHTIVFPLNAKHPARKIEQLKNGNGKLLLDIGCGNGSFASYVDENNFTITAMDIDESSLAIAKKRNLKNTTFIKGILPELVANIENHGKFDIITMFEVFEHLDNPIETIENIKKLLKPNGYFIGSLPNIDRPLMWKYNMDYELPPYHLTYWTIDSWKKFISKQGFVFEFAENSNYFGFISDVIRIKKFKSNKIISLFFVAFKKFIESPIEKLTNNGASFIFCIQKK